jgi:hypothetical protein
LHKSVAKNKGAYMSEFEYCPLCQGTGLHGNCIKCDGKGFFEKDIPKVNAKWGFEKDTPSLKSKRIPPSEIIFCPHCRAKNTQAKPVLICKNCNKKIY